MDAGEVILSAGSLNSTEILLRSEMHGLSVSPALGTKFSGNGDFFGLAYNGDSETDVLGYRTQTGSGRRAIRRRPGRTSWALVRYTNGLPEAQRIAIEDFSFPSAYVDGAKAVFGLLRGEDTVIGNEDAQRDRLARDFDPTAPAHDPRRRDEPLHAVPGDGAGRRARHRSSSRRRGPSPMAASASPGTRPGSSRSSPA